MALPPTHIHCEKLLNKKLKPFYREILVKCNESSHLRFYPIGFNSKYSINDWLWFSEHLEQFLGGEQAILEDEEKEDPDVTSEDPSMTNGKVKID